MTTEICLQKKYAPHTKCFGCGPENEKGLKIESFPRGEELVATWTPEKHHEAFPGVLNGGIIGALLDCHSNWTAAWALMEKAGQSEPPCTVTAKFAVELTYPTPTDGPLELSARVSKLKDHSATIEAKLTAKGKLCATCVGTFVAVKPGHPAYFRWNE